MERNVTYSKYGVINGIINIIIIIILTLILNKYGFNIISVSYFIFAIVSGFVYLKSKELKLYKSKDKKSFIYSLISTTYLIFNQIVIIMLILLYLKNRIAGNGESTMLFVININTFINILGIRILLNRSYITKNNKLYLNHKKLVSYKDIKHIKKDISKLGANSIYIVLKSGDKVKTEVTKQDYEHLKSG